MSSHLSLTDTLHQALLTTRKNRRDIGDMQYASEMRWWCRAVLSKPVPVIAHKIADEADGFPYRPPNR
jgi:hypothetical protein